jgi:hypothetical protein
VVLTCIGGVLLPPASASARTEGPFHGQVVEAETGAAIPGVVVVAYYERKKPGGVHPETEFYDLDETVTDAEGRFSLAPRTLPASTPLSHVVGPIFIFFKGGYKGWRFEGVEHGERMNMVVQEEQVEEAWRKLRRGESVVIVKSRATTRADRAREMGDAQPLIITEGRAEGRTPLLKNALAEEEIAIRNLR